MLRATADERDFLSHVISANVLTNGAFIDSNGRQVGIDSQLVGSGGVTKLGPGTVDLRGPTFLGELSTVDAGKLLVNGRFSGDIRVNAGATLGGNGQVVGAVEVLPGGFLSPGNSPGNLTIGSLVLGSGSHLLIELGALSDHLTVDGDLTLAGFIDFVGDPASLTSGTLPNFLSYSGTLTDLGIAIGSLPEGVDPQSFHLDFSTPGLVALGINGTIPTPVPEPSTTALMLLGLAAVLAQRTMELAAARKVNKQRRHDKAASARDSLASPEQAAMRA